MGNAVAVAAAIAAVSTLYATAGQAGGTAFLAVMAIGGPAYAALTRAKPNTWCIRSSKKKPSRT